MKTIGNTIKNLRETKKLNSKDLCDALGFSTSTYSKLENDRKSIDVHELKAIAQFYDVSADHILGIDEPKTDIVIYMQRTKNLGDEDINEVKMILSMMDQAISLNEMKSRR
jgi:transcriptional regulator with XRE-family HTH domain